MRYSGLKMKGAGTMRTVTSFDEMRSLVGDEIGVSKWIGVSQEKIDLFAEATGDFQWIHVDVERAKAEMPGGKTIAHGYFIPTVIDQNPCAHLRMPRDMIFHGWSMRLFQAWQHSATMSS